MSVSHRPFDHVDRDLGTVARGTTVPGARGLPADPAEIIRDIAAKTGIGDWMIVGKTLVRRDCAILFLRSSKFRIPELVMKIYRPGMVRANLAKDLDTKSHACHFESTPLSTVPEPVFFCGRRNVLVMERIPLPTCGALLRKGFHTRPTRDRINHGAARWLHWFHHLAPVELAPSDSVHFLRRIDAMKRRIESSHPSMFARDPALRNTLEAAGEVARNLHGHLVPHAATHGDFTPFNLFLRGEQTVGIDYFARRLPVSADICRFLLYLDLLHLSSGNRGELAKFGCRQADWEIFTESYGGDLSWASGGRWQQLQFLEVTRRLTSLALRRAEGRLWFFHLIESIRIRRTASLLMKSLFQVISLLWCLDFDLPLEF